MNKKQFEETILSGINKSIEGQLKSLKDNIMSNNVSVGNNKIIINNKSFYYSVNNNIKRNNFESKKSIKKYMN